MRKTAYLAGALAMSTASVVIGGTQAFADSADNDGVNLGNDNNLSALPIQLCGNNIAILGAVVPIASPQNVVCANAPIVEGPSEPPVEEPTEPPTEEPTEPPEDSTEPEPPNHQVPPGDETLPEAPAPVAVQGHHAVTG